MEFIALLIIIGAAVFIQKGLYRRYGMRRLDYRCYFSTIEAYEGDEIELIEEVSNSKWLPLPWLRTELATSKWLDFAESQSVVTDQTRFVPSFFTMKSYHKVVRRWRVKCLKRGTYAVDKVVVVGTDLLGMGDMSLPVDVDARLTVLPRPLPLEEMAVSSRHLTGDLVVRRQLLSDPFYIAGVREYTGLEPVNKINWLATAREKKLMVFQNDYTTSQSIAVLLNMQSRLEEGNTSLDRDNIENCIRVCASYFDDTLQSGIPVRFLSNTSLDGTEQPVVSNEAWGQEHVLELLRLLARLEFTTTEGFDSFLNGVDGAVTATDVVIVTCYLSPGIVAFARKKQDAGLHVRIAVLGLREADAADLPADCDVYCLYDYFAQRNRPAQRQGEEKDGQ
ncbi:MAG TPA: DUF58 domain-containing protein [Candidatus Gallacutalibacter stercoravium]|nr:DUF58 domain-containing protein [Candidatus Gallacutalibacter stercoravium]